MPLVAHCTARSYHRGLASGAPEKGGPAMTRQYLSGEVSVRLEQLQAAGDKHAAEVAGLRADAENYPPSALRPVVARALALADRMCWDSISRGDSARFDRQAAISADLRGFAVCAGLLRDEQ